MGVASSLLYRHVRDLRTAFWISLAASLIVLMLLVFAELLGLMSLGISPANEPVLMGPFRWAKPGAMG